MAIFCIEIVKGCLPRRKPTPIAPPDPLNTRLNSSVLTLPFPREIVGQGRKTNAQSQSLLLSSLPTEIRLSIWKLCIGGNTFHLNPVRFGRRERHTCFKHRLCVRVDPTLPRRIHSHCQSDGPSYRYKEKFKAFSLIVTCRQIYSETIDILYSTNAFRMIGFCAIHLQTTLLPQRLKCIRVLYLEIITKVTKAFVEDPKHQNETLKEWTDTWNALASLSGLQILHVELRWWSREWWTMLTDDQKSLFLQPVFSLTKPQEFDIQLPFPVPPEDSIWSALPFLQPIDSWDFYNPPCTMLL